MKPVIEAIDLIKYFPIHGGFLGRKVEYLKAVDSVTLTIYQGETLGLVGESGCGKTTVGFLLLNLLQADRGKVLYNGMDLTQVRGQDLRQVRRNLQIVFQDPQSSLDPRMLIKKTVGYPLEVNGLAKGEEVVTRVRASLAEVGLDEEHMYRYPHEFSGGQRQRIGIARALITGPEFIVFDEPTSALDVSVQAQILNLIKELQRRHGYSYLFISHNLSVIKHVSHRIAVMYLGKIVETASKASLFERPLHPYTQALLTSVPKPDPQKRHTLAVLSGDVPSPINVPAGCRFHPRCPQMKEKCSRLAPPYIEVEPGHSVACHLYGAVDNEAPHPKERRFPGR
jgi:peptide/nickel transport system ATP-binding protein/oligopeptide transport system ATP-binding protein